MINVRERLKLKKGTALVCDLIDPEAVTNKLATEIGIFEFPKFEVSATTACFSAPQTTLILLKTDKDCSVVNKVKFL